MKLAEIITADTQRRERSIGSKEAGSVKVQVAAPYKAGMTIGDGEAQMLNQTIAENVSNNLREKITAFVPAAPEGQPYGENNPAPAPRLATAEEAQALVDSYLANYEPGVRQGGGGAAALSPLDREIRDIATERLRALLKSQGIKQNQVNFAELRDQLIESNREKLEKQAKKIIAEREKGAADFDLGGLSLPGQADGGDEEEEQTEE